MNELREARPGDEEGILACIQALAEYEREPDAVENTAEAIHATLFGASPKAFCYVVEADGRIVAIRASKWTVLDWNAPSIAFYRKLGAEPMDEWTTQRVSGPELQHLARVIS